MQFEGILLKAFLASSNQNSSLCSFVNIWQNYKYFENCKYLATSGNRYFFPTRVLKENKKEERSLKILVDGIIVVAADVVLDERSDLIQ